MKSTLFIITLLLLVACGKEKPSGLSSSSSPYGAENNGVLSIPAPGMVGGGPTIMYGNSYMQMGQVSPEAGLYIDRLRNRRINIAALSIDAGSTKYRVNFTGTMGSGQCPFNPTAICSIVNLQSLRAY